MLKSLMKNRMRHILLLYVSLLITFTASAYVCNEVPFLTLEACGQYDYIAFGRVTSDINCEAHKVKFTPLNTFKGAQEDEEVDLYTSCEDDGVLFHKGDLWLVYGSLNNAQEIQVHVCGHSRKQFKNEANDFYVLERGSTFKKDFTFLKENFSEKEANRNELKPRKYEKVDPVMVPVLLGVGLLFMIVGIFVFKRLGKSKT